MGHAIDRCITLELRTGSDDITSNMCGFISSHLSVQFCDSVQSVCCNCCLVNSDLLFKPVIFTGKARVAGPSPGRLE